VGSADRPGRGQPDPIASQRRVALIDPLEADAGVSSAPDSSAPDSSTPEVSQAVLRRAVAASALGNAQK